MNTVYTAADAKKITALVGLDISAAFNTMMCLPAVSSHSSALSALPPAGYGLHSAAVKTVRASWQTLVSYDPV